jgi:3D (Asp-Asp-Asp) domain-containing protein
MSIAMLGAVRLAPQFRPEPLLAVSSPSEPTVAPWNDDTTPSAADDRMPPLGALNTADEPVLETPGLPAGLPAGAELLRALPPAPEAPTITAAPALIRPPTPPVLTSGRTRMMLMEVTAYCACHRCCGPRAQGITASGRRVSYNGGRFVAADTKILKFNTKLMIPGYANNQPVEVIDRGGAIKGNKLDVYFATHQEARKWGRQKLWVTVVE